jgi:hypothetical protein
MKKVCFIVSHLGSGSIDLLDILNKNPKCMIHDSKFSYKSPEDLNWLFYSDHRCRDSSAIYGDHLLFNTSFSCKKLYEYCKFIYVIRPPRATLNEINILKNPKYQPNHASLYYKYRLRRICEMAKRTEEAVFLTWDDLSKGTAFNLIEDYLGLKKQLTNDYHHFISNEKDSFEESIIKECEDAYERYYYYLSKLNLRRTFA